MKPYQDHYLLTEVEVDRLRELSESFHFALIEYIENRKIKPPPWEEYEEGPEFQNYQSIYEEVDLLKQEKFDF